MALLPPVPGRVPELAAFAPASIVRPDLIGIGAALVVQLGELLMILDLHRQGLSVTAIARRTGRDPKTVRKYIERRLELPAYGPRQAGRPNKIVPFVDYLRERVSAFPDLSAVRLTREIRERGYDGAYTAAKRFVAAIRPQEQVRPFEVRFETPAGYQAQIDFARFVTEFTDAPGVTRIVWLFSLVLGHSRYIFARYVMHQDLQTLLRCHMQAFDAIGGIPIEILYDRMKTAVTGEDNEGHIIYNRSLLALAKHFGFQPRACRPYRAKTKGKVERPFRYIREDFFLARSFRNLEDLNEQLRDWLDTVAPARHHATHRQRSLRGGAAGTSTSPGSSLRRTSGGRTNPARKSAHQGCSDDGAPDHHQDARRLRLRFPAIARSGPHHGAGRTEVHRAGGGSPSSRPARHRQEPSGDRARRRSRQGRKERLLLNARRHYRLAGQGRARGAVARAYPLSMPRIPAGRRRNRLSPGRARRRQSLLPARQCPLREGCHGTHLQSRLCRMGRSFW
ncbi:MAG: IS21 family transposase [Mesorhizobium sp.]|nr:MAG: IS21 family transposase [Mesorhizobium sp.]